jgi:putative Mg2+ transporter-C (MgtC) family protein
MAQGIMTGIGFLGAGVIFKQGFFSVAGLTTAASLWFTAALGIIYGLGFYYPAVLGTLAALFTLATLRWLEWRVTRQCFARLTLCFAKGSHHEPGQAGADFGRAGLCHSSGRLPANREWAMFEYKMVVSTFALKNFTALAGTLAGLPNVLEFHVSPTAE